MNDTDLIIFVIFLICVTYVLQVAIGSLDEQTKVEFQKGELTSQLKAMTLEETPLDEIVDVNFGFKPEDRFPFDKQPTSVLAIIRNKSKNVQIYVDWDKSTLSNYAIASRRVIHLNIADRSVTSAHQPLLIQAPNPISPGSLLSAQLAPEDTVKRNVETNVLEAKEPIVDFNDLEKKSTDTKEKKAPKDLKQKRLKFLLRREPLEFSLRLMLRMNSIEAGGGSPYEYSLLCKFKVINMPWWDQLPWNPKK
jgi:hypothetical protein